MAKNSNIEWTDSTVNFWWGCTKVGPGCDHCYAETWSKRTGGNIWGTGVPRRKIKSAVALLHRLDNDYSWWAADHAIAGHHQTSRRRVFVQSMSDLFDLEVPLEWFAEAWQTIELCDRLHIQIVTKRISVIEKRLAAIGVSIWPKHAGLIITVCNQAEADRDIPRLLALKMKLGIPWVGLSMEPLLGAVDLERVGSLESIRKAMPTVIERTERGRPRTGDGSISGAQIDAVGSPGLSITFFQTPDHMGGFTVQSPRMWPPIDWVIVGGESGPNARPMHPDWARSLRDQCAAAGVPFLFKQWGEWLPFGQSGFTAWSAHTRRKGELSRAKGKWWGHASFNDGAGGPTAQTIGPVETLIIGDQGQLVVRLGKKAAGRLLDGAEYNAMPRAFS